MSLTHCTGANYFKTGEDPKLLPDEEYPDWLWELAKPQLKISDYEKRKKSIAASMGRFGLGRRFYLGRDAEVEEIGEKSED